MTKGCNVGIAVQAPMSPNRGALRMAGAPCSTLHGRQLGRQRQLTSHLCTFPWRYSMEVHPSRP